MFIWARISIFIDQHQDSVHCMKGLLLYHTHTHYEGCVKVCIDVGGDD